MKKLTLKLPKDYVSALSRRHHGAKHTKERILKEYKHLKHLYKGYCRNRDREDWLLNVFWEEENIEDYYGSRKFINAHRRLRRCKENMDNFHRYMFACLTSFDGNGGQEYHRYGVICADEIMNDFKSKYIDGDK